MDRRRRSVPAVKFRILCCRIHIELSGCKALFLFELAAATAPVSAGESLSEQIGIAHAPRVSLRTHTSTRVAAASTARWASTCSRSSSLSIDRAHEVDSATRWGRHLAAAAADLISKESGSGRTRGPRRASDVGQRSDPRAERPAIGPTCLSRLGGAAAAGRTMVRSTAAPSRLVNLVGGGDGARAFAANADDDVAAAAAGRAASYGSSPTARSQPH